MTLRPLTLCMLSKLPIPGETKTRLIPALGPGAAAEFAKASLLDSLERFGSLPAAEHFLALAGVSGSGAPQPSLCDPWPPEPWTIGRQVEGDLGQRMMALFERSKGPVIFVGSDSPTMPPESISEAIRLLSDAKGCEAVFQPALDGGYTLAGFRNNPAQLLADMPWSTPTLLDKTLEIAETHGIRVGLLSPWYDIDEASDLRRLAGHLRAIPKSKHPPRVARLLPSLFPFAT